MNDISAASETQEVRIKLFGGFRQFREESTLVLDTGSGITVADLRSQVAGVFNDDDNALSLLKASAFATDNRVLDDEEKVPVKADLALLPPVCGG